MPKRTPKPVLAGTVLPIKNLSQHPIPLLPVPHIDVPPARAEYVAIRMRSKLVPRLDEATPRGRFFPHPGMPIETPADIAAQVAAVKSADVHAGPVIALYKVEVIHTLIYLHPDLVGDTPAKPGQRGWFFPPQARKAHYVDLNVDNRSFCGAWAFLGQPDALEDFAHDGPDNCRACVRERAKRVSVPG